jgi:hypothetical protein
MKWVLLALLLIAGGCATHFVEFEGECVIQQWTLASLVLRRRTLCDLPPRDLYETPLRDEEAMSTNPFPDLFDFDNKADSPDNNLLEKTLEYPPSEDDLEAEGGQALGNSDDK